MSDIILADVHSVRSQVYDFLYKVFVSYPAAKGFYENLENAMSMLDVLCKNTENEEMKQGINGLSEFLTELNAMKGDEKDEALLKVQQDHAMLLCLETSVYADESYYTSNDKKFKQESYDKIMQIYDKYGFALNDNINESEEHVSIELAFMSKLADMSMEALKNDDNETYLDLINEQYNFHVNHFDAWIYDFVDNIIKFPIDERIYKNVTRFMNGFLIEDKEFLKEIK